MEAPVFAEVDLVLFPGGGRSRLLPAIHTNRGVGVERAAGPGALPLAPSRGEGGLGSRSRRGGRPRPGSRLPGADGDRGFAGGRSHGPRLVGCEPLNFNVSVRGYFAATPASLRPSPMLSRAASDKPGLTFGGCFGCIRFAGPPAVGVKPRRTRPPPPAVRPRSSGDGP